MISADHVRVRPFDCNYNLGLINSHMYEIGPCVFPPQVSSNLCIWRGPTCRACHKIRKLMEKNVSCYCGIVYHFYHSSYSTNGPGDFPLVPSWRFLRPSCQIWRQLWHQSRFPIIPGWGCHLASPIPPPPTWRISSCDMLQPWWIRGFLRMMLEQKYCWKR